MDYLLPPTVADMNNAQVVSHTAHAANLEVCRNIVGVVQLAVCASQ